MPAFTSTPSATISFNDLTSDTGIPTLANAYVKITDSDTATWLGQEPNVNGSYEALFNATSTASGAQSITGMDAQITGQLDGLRNDDDILLWVQFVESGGASLTTDAVLFDASTMDGSEETNTVSLSLVTNNPVNWTDHRIKLRWAYTKSKGSDPITLRVLEVVFTGTYTAAPLGAKDVDGSGLVQRGAIIQTHTLGIKSVNNTGVVEPKNIVQTHPLLLKDVSNTGAVNTGGIGVTHVLGLEDVNSTGAVNTGAIETAHLLSARHLVAEGLVQPAGMPYLIRHTWPNVNIGVEGHVLACKDVSNSGLVSTGAISTSHILTCRDVDGTGEVQPVEIQCTHVLAAFDVNATHSVQSAAMSQKHVLGAKDVSATGEVQTGPIGTEHKMGAKDVSNTGAVELVELPSMVQPPVYNDLTDYIDEPLMVDLSVGWSAHDPNGFSVDQLPTGLSMSIQGMVSGTPTVLGDTFVTVSNEGSSASFTWHIIERPVAPPDDAATSTQALAITIQIGVNA